MDVNQPLLSVGQTTDKGCVTVFTKKKVIICNKSKIDIKPSNPPLVEGDRSRNGLWHVSSYNNKAPIIYCTKTAYKQDESQDLAIYLHVCVGFPVITTWIVAIKNGNQRDSLEFGRIPSTRFASLFFPFNLGLRVVTIV